MRLNVGDKRILFGKITESDGSEPIDCCLFALRCGAKFRPNCRQMPNDIKNGSFIKVIERWQSVTQMKF